MHKKLLFLVIIFTIILGPISVAQASLGNPLLRVGSTGSDVIQLQTELNYLSYNAGTADGIFGPKTRAAVISFQSASSLSPDGIVGPLTAGALNKAYDLKKQQAQQTTSAQAIVTTAEKYIGVPYRYGGTSPSTGFDCSGFVQYVFAQNGITLPRISKDQYTVGSSVSFNSLQPGDLVFFSIDKNGIVDHDGIYVGNGQFINASSSKGVTIYSFGPYWNSVYLGARRIIQ